MEPNSKISRIIPSLGDSSPREWVNNHESTTASESSSSSSMCTSSSISKGGRPLGSINSNSAKQQQIDLSSLGGTMELQPG